jgi:hypothetical protein
VVHDGIELIDTSSSGIERDPSLGDFSGTVTPAYRELLIDKQFFDFHSKAITPLPEPSSFELASLVVSKDQNFFKNNNKIMTLVYVLETRLVSFCMDSIFYSFPFDPITGNIASGTRNNLLENVCTISEAEVRFSN